MPTEECRVTLLEFGKACVETWRDRVELAIGVTLASFPAWRPMLHSASDVAADITPIFGLFWLAIQAYAKLVEIHRRRDG